MTECDHLSQQLLMPKSYPQKMDDMVKGYLLYFGA